jgi:hypothetical protein
LRNTHRHEEIINKVLYINLWSINNC